MVDKKNKSKKGFDGKLKDIFSSAVATSESIKDKTVDLTVSAKDNIVSKGIDAANIVKDKAMSAADSTLETASKVSGTVKTKADELGVSDKVHTGVSAAKKTVDVFTGEEQLRLIEERLTLQMRYNDVLATKLDEALSRIKALEDKIEQSS